MIIGSCTAGYFRWPASEASGHWERLAARLRTSSNVSREALIALRTAS